MRACVCGSSCALHGDGFRAGVCSTCCCLQRSDGFCSKLEKDQHYHLQDWYEGLSQYRAKEAWVSLTSLTIGIVFLADLLVSDVWKFDDVEYFSCLHHMLATVQFPLWWIVDSQIPGLEASVALQCPMLLVLMWLPDVWNLFSLCASIEKVESSQ